MHVVHCTWSLKKNIFAVDQNREKLNDSLDKTGGKCCGQNGQYGQYKSAIEVEEVMKQKHRHGATIALTGDLNVQHGCENR